MHGVGKLRHTAAIGDFLVMGVLTKIWTPASASRTSGIVISVGSNVESRSKQANGKMSI